MLQYVVTNLEARDTLDISNNEAMYLFAVHYFERDRDGGFCSVWGSQMAKIVKTDERNIRNIKKRMEERGLITIRASDGAVRVTDKYRDVCNASRVHLADYFKAKAGHDNENTPDFGAEKSSYPPGKKFRPPPEKSSACRYTVCK